MKPDQIEAELQSMLAGAQTPRATIAKLIAGGGDETDSTQLVFAALGGSDLVEVGEDQRERYMPSGKLVSEVAVQMAK
jgi:hypothetical protein